MPSLISILLLHTHVRYLRSMIPWPAQPIYTVHICYSAWRPILILKHTSTLWDLFTGTTYFAHTRWANMGSLASVRPYSRWRLGLPRILAWKYEAIPSVTIFAPAAFRLILHSQYIQDYIHRPRLYGIYRKKKVNLPVSRQASRKWKGLQNRLGVACKYSGT